MLLLNNDTQRNLNQSQAVMLSLEVTSGTQIAQEAAAYSFTYHSDKWY